MSRTVRWFRWAVVALALAVAMGGRALAQGEEAAAQNKASNAPRLDFPTGLATDGQALFVANGRNNTIGKIDLASHGLSILAGQLFKEGNNDGPGSSAGFNDPSGMAMIRSDLYVADSNNSIIRKITSSGMVSTFAGTANISGSDDGKGSAAHFNLPAQVAADPGGNRLFVSDTANSIIRMISVPDAVVKTIGGQPQSTGKADGPATKSQFNQPRGLASDGKFVYIADTGNDVIRKIDLSGMTTSTIAGTGEEGNTDGAGDKAQFNNPGAIATDGTMLYVLDADNHAIRKINIATNEVGTVTLVNGHIGSGCTISADKHSLYFSDTTENAVAQVDLSNGNVTTVYPLH